MSEQLPRTCVTLPGARVALIVTRHHGRTVAIDPATGIYGVGVRLGGAVEDFKQAVRDHRDVLEQQSPLTGLLQAQLETVREYLGQPPLASGARTAPTEAGLTLAQGVRLVTAGAIPDVDALLAALEHAVSLKRLTAGHYETLAETARVLRRIARPAKPEKAPDAPCWRCPPDLGDLIELRLPHTSSGHQTYTYLMRNGYTDRAAISATSDEVLGRIRGISAERLEEIRIGAPYIPRAAPTGRAPDQAVGIGVGAGPW